MAYVAVKTHMRTLSIQKHLFTLKKHFSLCVEKQLTFFRDLCMVWKDFCRNVNGGMRKHSKGTTESLGVPNCR